MSIESNADIFALRRVAQADANVMLSGDAALQRTCRGIAAVEAPPPSQQSNLRISVDGRFFRRGAHRIRVNGVTYGPFAPNTVGEALPEPDCVESDLLKMRAAGINAMRI